jgi:hypothetical protein
LETRLTILLCKIIVVAKPKEVNTELNLAESSKASYGSKRVALPMMMMMMIMMMTMIWTGNKIIRLNTTNINSNDIIH